MTCQLAATDCLGNAVELEHSNWQKHLGSHPEMAAYHQLLANALAYPDLVLEVQGGIPTVRQRHYYRWGVGQGKYAQRPLRIIVEDFGDGGHKVKTAHFVQAVRPRGVVKWNRRQTP